ncbi:MAG TPA: PLxRFG domain-containing protein, partial [Candidatus Tenderia sp.]|nr:PLxRFG domain-containing protein [Candidatus Tenderia sp.]
PQLDKVLDGVYRTLKLKQPDLVRELNREYRFDLRTREGKRRLAEEALARMAENEANRKPLQGTWKRFLAWVKRWMARMGFPVTFTDEQLQDILADAATHVREGKATRATGRAAFSLSHDARTMARLDAAVENRPTWETWKAWGKEKWGWGKATLTDDTRPGWLGALTRWQIADIYGEAIPQLKAYVKTAQRMDADRNHLVVEAAELAKDWHKFYARNPAAADALADVMHESTLAGVDPSEEYVSVIDEADAREQINGLRAQARSRSGEGTAKFLREIKEIKARVAFEKTRPKAYQRLRKQYQALSPEAKRLYKEIRDFYAARFEATKEALIKRIERANLSASQKRNMITKLRLQFESAKVEAPYFPLARFGEFWVSREKGDTREFYMFSGSYEQKQFARQSEREGWSTRIGKQIKDAKSAQGASEGFVADVIGILDEVGGSQAEQVKDEVYQLFLSALPDMSVRKHFIHRKKTKGFTRDALRAFAHQAFHGSYQLAKLRYSDILEEQLNTIRETAGETTDPDRTMDVYHEMVKRHEWAMNPQSGRIANAITSFNFVWYLGLTPAAAIMNVTQTAFVAFPAMAAKFGWTRSAKALMRASQDFVSGGFDAVKNLDGDERRALEQLVADGVIDKTQAHDLAGMSETPSAIYGTKKARAMEIVSFLFHHAERYNREVTALAAYRLARRSGQSHEEAVDLAANTIWETHFDYSNANKARWMQSDTAKVLLVFRQYSQNMTYFLLRNFRQMIKGESKSVRRLARRKLAGVMGVHALTIGVYGLPMFWFVEWLANSWLDDEDDPWDFKTEFRNFLADYLGEAAADAITVGSVQTFTGVGIHDRASLNELWLRSPDRDLEGRDLALYWLAQVGGPSFGIISGVLDGWKIVDEGHIQRGIEKMLPKVARDGLKAMRYASEGVLSFRGDPILEEINPWEVGLQAIGFTPGEVAKQYDRRRAIKGYVEAIQKRRRYLVDRWWLATRMRDREGVREVLAAIRQFNKKQPQNRITRDTLVRSAKMRRRASRETVDGVRLPKRMRHLREEVRY